MLEVKQKEEGEEEGVAEWIYKGKHKDEQKTKALQEQGNDQLPLGVVAIFLKMGARSKNNPFQVAATSSSASS